VACFGIPQTLNLSNKEGEPARWTVIIGDNAIGKTTLLRSLAGISPFISKKNGATVNMASGMFGELLRAEREANVEANFAIDYRFVGRKQPHHVLKRKFKAKGDLSTISSDGEFDNVNFVCYGYGAARRMSPSGISSEKRDLTLTALSLFKDDADLINAEDWLLQADYISAKDKKYLKYKKQVEDIILNLLPDVKSIDYRFDKRTSYVMFETPSGWVRIHQLGLGYRTMLAWMVDFAAGLFDSYPESKNPLEEPAILLIDEIDLHLHPKWQRTIIDYLTRKFPNTQFIVTAHSPLLVQAATGANLVLLKRKGDNIIIDNDPVSVENWRVDQILTSDLFGIKSAHSAATQKILEEKTRILSKRILSSKESQKLNELDDMLSTMPFGETKEEIQADFLIKEIARKISQRDTVAKDSAPFAAMVRQNFPDIPIR